MLDGQAQPREVIVGVRRVDEARLHHRRVVAAAPTLRIGEHQTLRVIQRGIDVQQAAAGFLEGQRVGRAGFVVAEARIAFQLHVAAIRA